MTLTTQDVYLMWCVLLINFLFGLMMLFKFLDVIRVRGMPPNIVGSVYVLLRYALPPVVTGLFMARLVHAI